MYLTSMFFSNCASSYDHVSSFLLDLNVKMNHHQDTQYFYLNSINPTHLQAKSLHWKSDNQQALMPFSDTDQLHKSLPGNYHSDVRWSTTSLLLCHLGGYHSSEMRGKACIVTLYVCWEHIHTNLSNTWYLYKNMLCQIFSQVILEVSKKNPLLADAFVSCLPHSAATPSSVQKQNSFFFFQIKKQVTSREKQELNL